MCKYFKSTMVATVAAATLFVGCSSSGGVTPGGNPNTPTGQPIFNQTQLLRIENMLTSVSNDNSLGGFGYTALNTDPSINGKFLPVSYYNTAQYWGNYVCAESGTNCNVSDYYGNSGFGSYNLDPMESDESGGTLQIERVIVNNGVDIYDAATWQIAIALLNAHQISTAPVSSGNQNALLNLSQNGSCIGGCGTYPNRTNKPPFVYVGGPAPSGGTQASNIDANYSYIFRLLPQAWLSADPFMNTSFANYVTAYNLPTPSAPYESGLISWLDYKPITGENAWAFLTGPIQASYLNNNGVIESSVLSSASKVITTLGFMQSQIGAFYYEPQGGTTNSGSTVNAYTVSIENNASLLAGLLMLESGLTSHGVVAESNGTEQQVVLYDINSMIHGGTVYLSYGLKTPTSYSTAGVLSFFKNYAYDHTNHIFYQEGHANDPSEAPNVWVPGVDENGNLKTVDVNTWTTAVLGVPLIDSWFGSGAAYNIWQHVKQFGGYYGPDSKLWGVGYSESDHNGCANLNSCSPTPNGILSVEWTAGAINMVRALLIQYGTSSNYASSLAGDLKTMQDGVMQASTDTYPANASMFTQNAITNYNDLLTVDNSKLGFMYATRRYYIPFGWYANPLPALCSTSWMVMVNYWYNPFTLGGTYTPNFPANAQ